MAQKISKLTQPGISVLLEGLDWDAWLVPDGLFCLEWGKVKSAIVELPEKVGSLVKIREKNYGYSVLTTYRRAGS